MRQDAICQQNSDFVNRIMFSGFVHDKHFPLGYNLRKTRYNKSSLFHGKICEKFGIEFEIF